LQSALIELFGTRIKQSGSFVGPDYFRFDFTYPEGISTQDLKKLEDLVNKKIRENIPVCIEYMTLEQSIKKGVLAFFGEKYRPEQVRVVEVPGFSAELCCGTHVRATGDIGVLKITEEKALAAGQRRIIAVTGRKAVELFQEDFNTIKRLSNEFKVKREDVLTAINTQKEQMHTLQADVKRMRLQLLETQLPVWEKQIKKINDVPYLFLLLEDRAHDELKDIAQRISMKKPGLYVLVSSVDGRSFFFVTLSKQFKEKIPLKELATWLKDSFGLRGGGSALQLQGGGGALDTRLEKALYDWLKEQVR